MKLRKIHIQNFRGIKNLEMEFDDLVVLIGENNTGKTAVLHALRLCLRDRRRSIDPFDFHLTDEHAIPNNAEPISVTVTFGESEEARWDEIRIRRLKDIIQVEPISDLNSVMLRVTCSYDTQVRDFTQNFAFLNTQGEVLPGKGEQAMVVLQREITFYLLDALRDAGRNFDAKGPFWRPFLKDGQLSDEKKNEIERMLHELNELVVASHENFEKVRERLKAVQKVVPMQAGDVVAIEAVPGRIFDMLSKAQVHLGTTTGAKVPVGRHGEGTQSLAVLMLFAAFLDLDAEGGKGHTPLVGLEEPEAHLHPSAVRTLWQTLEKIPGQKIISTHSGELLSQIPIEAVRRLARTSNGVDVFRLRPGTLDKKQQRMFDFHIRRTRGELLFARCWLLGEGETEVTLFQEIARHLSIDLERSGVRCIPYRMGASIELFLKVANDLGIHWCALTDNDSQGQADQRHLSKNLPPGVVPADVCYMMQENDIESHLCGKGFLAVYEQYLTPQLSPNLTVSKQDPSYQTKLLAVIKGSLPKPDAALQVVEEIRAGRVPVPSIIEAVIRKAVELAGGV